ncbi:putative transporter [Pirellula sp. SH-Sr6A]|uniref:MFS transporter n=1 Tax=Pirellula sp. SH-Sr6A TaxID=1632865 RepID=UPI00078BD0D2|nr:MFS transporter [Pirellula sp. SH-Sr6A]AMV31410.1 putative transporter [Pirellula sp. SH-Sr6A]
MFLVKLISAIAYIGLGLPDAMLGIAWPSMRRDFDVSFDALGWILASTFSGYLISSSMASRLAKRLGIGWLLIGSCATMTFVVAGLAWSPYFYLTVAIGFVGGVGGGAIDASLNSFTAHRFSIRMVNWLHGCWGIGACIGPLLMTWVIVSGFSWRWGYAIVAFLLANTTLLIWWTRREWKESDDEAIENQPQHASFLTAFLDKQVLGQCFLFFVYTGMESTVGQLLFTLWTEGRGVSASVAGGAVTGYWIAFTLSRFIMGQLTTVWSSKQILTASGVISPILAAGIAFPPFAFADQIAAVLLGAWIAPMFPTWIGLTPATVRSDRAAQAIGFQVSSAAIGIVVLPGLISSIAVAFGLEAIPIALFILACAFTMTQSVLLARSSLQ